MDMISFSELQQILAPNLERLKHFHFEYNNPLFWGLIAVVFLVLWRLWRLGKSLSFSLIVASILLFATQIEGSIGEPFLKRQGTFDPLLIRVLTWVLIVFIFIYYFFIRED